MKELKNTTKQAQQFISNYNYYIEKYGERESIYSIYERPSQKKFNANEYCKQLKKELNGVKYCLLGHNSDFFSVGFKFEENGKQYLAYITHANNYKIALN